MSKVRELAGYSKNHFSSGTKCEEIPLFSPSVVPSRERVLHSIFSPANAGGKTTMRPSNENTTSLSVHQNEAAAPSKSTKKAAKSHSVLRNTTLDSTELFFTPDARKTNKSTIQNLKSPHSISFATAHDECFSPAIFVSSATSGNDPGASPLSHISAGTTSSFKNLPIEMLSFDYVQKCRSVQDLEQVVTALSSTGSPNNYPSLLRTATKQLHSIRNESFHSPASDLERIANQKSIQTPNSVAGKGTRSEKSNTLMLESILDDSLIMSFSSSVMGQMDTLDQAQQKKDTLQEEKVAQTSHPINDATPQSDDSNSELHNGKKSPETSEQDDLKNEVQRLQSVINQMTTNQKTANDLSQAKMKSLEEAKVSAEQDIVILEETVASSAAKSEQLEMSLAQTRKESHDLERALQREKALNEEKSKEYQETVKELRIKMNSLTLQLARSTEKQEKLRRELHNGPSLNRAEIVSLRKSLEETVSNLEELKVERYSMVNKIRESVGLHGSSKEEIDKMQGQSRVDMVDNIANKIASLKTSSKTLSEALAESENGRMVAVEHRERASRRYDQLKMSSERLERENLLLTKQIQELTEDLTKGQTEIENLMKFSQVTRSEWDSRENEYRETVMELKSKLRQDEKKVSLSAYRKAVDISKKQAEECEENRCMIKKLSAQVRNLEKQLKEGRLTSQAASTLQAATGSLDKNQKGRNTLRQSVSQISSREGKLDAMMHNLAITEQAAPALQGATGTLDKNQKGHNTVKQSVSQISSREGKLDAMMHNLAKESRSVQKGSLMGYNYKAQTKREPLAEKVDNTRNSVRNNKVFPQNSKRDKLESMRRKMEKQAQKLPKTVSPAVADENVNLQTQISSVKPVTREKSVVKAQSFVLPDKDMKNFDRKQMIRQAGGRKGLSDRVKQMRHISFKKTN